MPGLGLPPPSCPVPWLGAVGWSRLVSLCPGRLGVSLGLPYKGPCPPSLLTNSAPPPPRFNMLEQKHFEKKKRLTALL